MYERILVPIDGSNVSRLGLQRAIETVRGGDDVKTPQPAKKVAEAGRLESSPRR